LSTTASDSDAVARSNEVTSMKAPRLLAAAGAAALALLTLSPDSLAQAPRGGGGFQGAPPPGGGGARIGAPPGGAYPGRPPGGHPGGHPGARPPGWGGYRPPHYHSHGSVYLGFYGPGYWWGPGYWPGYWWGPGYAYPPAYGYYYPPAYARQAPPVYIEREPVEPQQVWWYWCVDAKAYYPYVKECPGGWQRVAPQSVAPPLNPQ
jgi:hypothetical protein